MFKHNNKDTITIQFWTEKLQRSLLFSKRDLKHVISNDALHNGFSYHSFVVKLKAASLLLRIQADGFNDLISLNKQPAILHKIFQTNFSFPMKQRTNGKFQFLFFRCFLLVLTKLLF